MLAVMLSQVGDQIGAYYDYMVNNFGQLGVQVLKIIWINILLSGDNAVVIALACRSLPQQQRKWGILLVRVPFFISKISRTTKNGVHVQFV